MDSNNIGRSGQRSLAFAAIDPRGRGEHTRKKSLVGLAQFVAAPAVGQRREVGIGTQPLVQLAYDGFDAGSAAEPLIEGGLFHVVSMKGRA